MVRTGLQGHEVQVGVKLRQFVNTVAVTAGVEIVNVMRTTKYRELLGGKGRKHAKRTIIVYRLGGIRGKKGKKRGERIRKMYNYRE